METGARPRGRRPGNDDTRGTIRDTARRLFLADGYDRVSLRAIAREADVDPALVHHYFDSKGALFSEALLDGSYVPADIVADILAGGPDEVGTRAARSFLSRSDEMAARGYLDLMKAGEQRFVELRGMNEFTAREIYQPIAEHFGHADAALRGQLAASAGAGMFLARTVLGMRPLSTTAVRTLVAALGVTLQQYLVGSRLH